MERCIFPSDRNWKFQSMSGILQIRYFHKFDFTITCPEALKNYSCIKLLLQPILENSIYHGIKGLTGTEFFILRRKMLGIVSGLRFQTTDVDFQKKTTKKSGSRMPTTSESKVSSSEFCSTTDRVMDYLWKVPTGGCITVITLPKQEGLPCH